MENYHKYLTITPVEIKWGLYVNALGYSISPPRKRYPNVDEHPTTHAFTWDKGRILDGYYLVFISKGKGVFESSRTAPVTVEEGTCFFLFPGVWHRYKPDFKSGWEEYWVGFNGSYPVELMNKHFFSPNAPFIHAGLRDDLLQLFLNMIGTVKLSLSGYHQIISGMMLQMLGLINALSVFGNIKNNDSDKLIRKAKFIMRESIEDPLNLSEIARELPMGYSNFRKSFKKATGISPTQYYLDIRLNKSKELLLSTNLKVDQIADQTGFSDVSYFSRLFRKKNGLTPGGYRTRHAAAMKNQK